MEVVLSPLIKILGVPAQWVKDPALLQLWRRSQLWLGFDPWPWNCHMPCAPVAPTIFFFFFLVRIWRRNNTVLRKEHALRRDELASPLISTWFGEITQHFCTLISSFVRKHITLCLKHSNYSWMPSSFPPYFLLSFPLRFSSRSAFLGSWVKVSKLRLGPGKYF